MKLVSALLAVAIAASQVTAAPVHIKREASLIKVGGEGTVVDATNLNVHAKQIGAVVGGMAGDFTNTSQLAPSDDGDAGSSDGQPKKIKKRNLIELGGQKPILDAKDAHVAADQAVVAIVGKVGNVTNGPAATTEEPASESAPPAQPVKLMESVTY